MHSILQYIFQYLEVEQNMNMIRKYLIDSKLGEDQQVAGIKEPFSIKMVHVFWDEVIV